MSLSFGQGETILVNAIIGLRILREWQLVLDVSESQVFSKVLDTNFDLSFQHASSGLPADITFSKDDFIYPICPNSSGNTLVTQLATTTATSVIIKESDDTVVLD